MALVDMLCADFLATADLDQLFTASSGWAVSAGAGPRGNAAFYSVNGGVIQRTPMSVPSGSTAIVGCRLKFSALPGGARDIIQVLDTGGIQVSLDLNADGTLSVYRGGTQFGTLLGTSSLTIAPESNHYLELKTVIGNTGSATVYVNGVSALALTSVDTMNTANATWNTYSVIGPGSLETTLTDIYAADGTAGEVSDVVGDVRVDAHVPTSDGAVDEWTPSSGSDAYAMLDDATPDGDTTVIETSTTGLRTVCGFENFIPTGATIKGIAVVWNMAKTDAGASTVAPVIRRSATNYDGTAQAPNETNYEFFGQVYETDPDTSAAWTEANFNAMEVGVKKEA